jgi:predicted DNA-binding protein
MECANGYKSNYEIKQKHLFVRMDDSMIDRLQAIKKKSGISVSEIIRESVRRLFQEADESGSINLKVN